MSLTDIYQLTKLPRVSADLASLVQITSDSDSEFLKLGVSGSSVSKYVLKPSPRLVWSKSVPPGFAISCIESYALKREVKEEVQENEEDEDKMDVDEEDQQGQEQQQQQQAADEVEEKQEDIKEEVDEYFVYAAYDKTKKQHILQTLKVLPNDSELTNELKSSTKIISLKVNVEANILVIVTEEEIKALDLQTYETKWELKNLYVAEYVKYLPNEVILVIERSKTSKNLTKLNYRLVNQSGVEVNSKIVEHSGSDLTFKYDIVEGVLYQYNKATNEIVSYQLPHFTQLKSLNLSSFGFSEGDIVAIKAPAKDRLLISTKKQITLVNLRFEITLAKIPSTKDIHSILSIELPLRNNAGVINQSYQSFITISRGNEVAALSYTLDSNTIRDSLGKQPSAADVKVSEVPSILDIKQTVSPIDEILDSSLSAYDFDRALFTYLQASQDYYTENDRIVSSRFITKAVEFIFATYAGNLPERVLTYLLTHPLFPQYDDLLAKLRTSPRLLRQAIVTSNISLKELISELNTTENSDIFKDLITRILEFPRDKLNFADLDAPHIIAKIIELDYGFELVSLLIDSNGILMWKDESYLEELIRLVESKITTLQGNAAVLSTLEALEGKASFVAGRGKTGVPLYGVETLSFN